MKLYLWDTSIETTPRTRQSTSMPAGTANNQSWIRFRMRGRKGTGGQSLGNVTTLAQTARQDSCLKPWLGDRLAAQTIPAQTWTSAFAAYQNNDNANSFFVPILYVWRPSTETKVGTIYDASTALGNEYALTTETGRVVTFAGAEVTVEADDYLVLEVWQTNTQAAATSYSTEWAYKGATEPTEGTTTTDAATYLESPYELEFLTSTTYSTRIVPTWIATGAKVEGTATGLTPVAPTHEANDILLLFAETGPAALTLSTANGYVELTNSTTGADTCLTIFWKRATAAGSASPIIGTPNNHCVAFIEVYRGCVTTGNPWEDLTKNQQAATTAISISGATIYDSERLVIAVSAHSDDSAIATTSHANSNLGSVTLRGEVGTAQGNDGALTVINGTKATPGDIGATTATSAASLVHANASFTLVPLSSETSAFGPLSLSGD